MSLDVVVWTEYGLSSNPYFYQALEKDLLKLFTGKSREKAAEKLTAFIHAGGSPLLLLEGGPGVGKTTLVNYAKQALQPSGEFFIYPRRVEISAGSTRENLAAEYLAAMTTTALREMPQINWKQDPRWVEAHDAIRDAWKSGGFSVGGSFAGFGANLTRTHVLQAAKVMPWETWKALLRNVLDALLEQRRGFIAHLNNLDAVSDTRPEEVQQLFDESRELLTIDGITTILCGSSSFRESVIADRQRLLDVIQPVDRLTQLEPAEFLDAVHERYNFFHDGDAQLVEPVEDAALSRLYEVFEGDMRNTFRIAVSAVVLSSLTRTDTVPLTSEDLLALIAQHLENEYASLGEAEQDVVDYLLEHGESPSQSNIHEATNRPQPTISQASTRLEHKRWITTTAEGRRRTYRLSGYGTLLQEVRSGGLV